MHFSKIFTSVEFVMATCCVLKVSSREKLLHPCLGKLTSQCKPWQCCGESFSRLIHVIGIQTFIHYSESSRL